MVLAQFGRSITSDLLHLAEVPAGPVQNIVPLGEAETDQVLSRIIVVKRLSRDACYSRLLAVSYTHLTLPTNREV